MVIYSIILNKLLNFLSIKNNKKTDSTKYLPENINIFFNYYDSKYENKIILILNEISKEYRIGCTVININDQLFIRSGSINSINIIPGFRFYPNNLFKRDFLIPIGDVTLIKPKSSSITYLGKNILKIINDLQQEKDIPSQLIQNNKELGELVWLYNFDNNQNKNELRIEIIEQINEAFSCE